MKLSAEIIYWKLQQAYPQINAQISENDELDLIHPLMSDGASPLTASRPYVMSEYRGALAIGEKHPLAVICTGGKPEKLTKYIDCLWFDDAHDTAEVLNAITLIFDEFERWQSDLEECVDNEAAAANLLRVCRRMFPHPLALLDAALYVVALDYDKRTTQSWPFLIAPWENRFSDEQVSELVRSFSTPHNQHSLVDESFIPMTNAPVLAMSLFREATYLGSLSSIEPNGGYSPHDRQLFLFIASYARRILEALSGKSSSNDRGLAALLGRMLNGSFVEREDLDLQCVLAGFREGDRYRCLSLQCPGLTPELAERIAISANEIAPGIFISQVGATLSLVENISLTERKPHADGSLDVLLKEYRMKAGCSDCFSDLSDIARYQKEADHALHYALEQEECHLLPFEACRARYALDHCAGNLETKMLYPDGLRRVIEFDRVAQVSYVDTLRVYLEENQNAAAAARRLGIQRNSLLTRLEKLDGLLGLNLGDPSIRLHLQLCLALKARDVSRR